LCFSNERSHDGPGGGPPLDFDEASLKKGLWRTRPRKGVREAAHPRLNRVTFDNVGPAPFRMLNGGAKQFNRHPTAAKRLGDKETHDRPDRLVVHALERA